MTPPYLYSPPDGGAARIVVTGHMIDRWDDQERFPWPMHRSCGTRLSSLVDTLQSSIGALHLSTSATQGVHQAFRLGRALLAHTDRYLSATRDGNMAQKVAWLAVYWQDGRRVDHPHKGMHLYHLAHECLGLSYRTILREWRQFIGWPEPSPGEQGGTAALGQQARS